MKRTILTPKQVSWLTETRQRNRALFGGWSMKDDSGDAGSEDSDKDAGDDQDDTAAEDDTDGGEPDWKARFEAQQRINRGLERKGRKDMARIKELEGSAGKKAGEDKDQPDVDQIRAEAKAEAAREVLHSRLEDKIEAKARAFADPEDAVAVLLRSHDHDDFLDGDKLDVEAITEALAELGEKKPHLLAQGGKRFQGDADGGTRKEESARAKSLGEAISRHYDTKS